MPPKLLIWGASGHARVIAEIIRLGSEYELAGLLDDSCPEGRFSPELRLPVLGGREKLAELHQSGISRIIIGVGDCPARLLLAQVAEEAGFQLVTAIHPSAIVSPEARLGDGSVVAAGAVINPGAIIGRNCIVNTSASVDHECILEDGAHVSPGAHLAGRVHVGRAAWICIGATVCDRVSIGAGSVVGSGSVVTRNVPEGVVVYGVPARVIREVIRGSKCGTRNPLQNDVQKSFPQ